MTADANAVKKPVNKVDVKVDSEIVYEFGGPVGVTAMMIFFPCLMYYLWICLEYYQGALALPHSVADIVPFLGRMVNHVREGAPLTMYGLQIYGTFFALQALLAITMPGPVIEGLPVPSEGGKKLKYLCNGVWSFYVTLIVTAVLHFGHIWRLSELIDNFGPVMSAAVLFGFAVTLLTYLGTVLFGRPHRMSGSFFYDLFMGAPLNPRLFGGRLDLKMWSEIRIPWKILFFVSLSAAAKQYDTYGYVPFQTGFMVLAHLLYVNACMKGEECIPTTWDIFYEKWGFMLIFWNLAGVPFTYCYSTLYLLKRGPGAFAGVAPWYNYTLLVVLLAAYYVWDTANSQKNRFRMSLNESYIPRKTFPQLPWGTIHNPTFIKTEHGSYLLTSGWWGIARKIHYTADLIMALCWGMICGFDSLIPYFYVTFFTCVLVHRVSRDMTRCAKKYGDDWKRYCQKVPYIFIPYVY